MSADRVQSSVPVRLARYASTPSQRSNPRETAEASVIIAILATVFMAIPVVLLFWAIGLQMAMETQIPG